MGQSPVCEGTTEILGHPGLFEAMDYGSGMAFTRGTLPGEGLELRRNGRRSLRILSVSGFGSCRKPVNSTDEFLVQRFSTTGAFSTGLPLYQQG